MQIERREDPYLDDELKKMLQTEVIPRFPSRQAATLPVLHAVQHKHSWIPYQALEEAAEFLESTAWFKSPCIAKVAIEIWSSTAAIFSS